MSKAAQVPVRVRVRERTRRLHPSSLLLLLTVVPALSMLTLVNKSSQMQWNDYWYVLPAVTNADGSLNVANVPHYVEAHLLAIPSLIFWINMHLTDGLNRPLGYFAIVLVIAQIMLLRSLLAHTRLGPWWRAGLVLAFAVLLFAPQGAWNFSRAMSGSAWLTANLFTLCAIALATRQRLLVAIPFALAASVTYGTGLMAWPAVVIVALVNGRGRDARTWAVIGAGMATYAAYALTYNRPKSLAPEFVVNDVVRRLLQVLGATLSPNPDLAAAIGAIGIGLAVYLAVSCLREREVRLAAAPWIAIAAYALLAGAMIGSARGGGPHPVDLGVASRYASLSALLWIAILALAVLRLQPDSRLWFAGFVITAVGFSSGQPAVATMETAATAQDELAIAVRLGLSEGYPYAPPANTVSLMRSVGHYPFSSQYDFDCGLTGKRLDRASIVPATPGTLNGYLDSFETPWNAQSVRPAGWYGNSEGAVRCIVITDGALKVVGAAALGVERGDLAVITTPTGTTDIGFQGVAPAGLRTYRAFAVLAGRHGYFTVPGQLSPSPG